MANLVNQFYSKINIYIRGAVTISWGKTFTRLNSLPDHMVNLSTLSDFKNSLDSNWSTLIIIFCYREVINQTHFSDPINHMELF